MTFTCVNVLFTVLLVLFYGFFEENNSGQDFLGRKFSGQFENERDLGAWLQFF